MNATPSRDSIASLGELKAATIRCRECPIGEFATQSVIGEGNSRARLMLVGEQPGDQEDLQGRPFVGPAGRLLAQAPATWNRHCASSSAPDPRPALRRARHPARPVRNRH